MAQSKRFSKDEIIDTLRLEFVTSNATTRLRDVAFDGRAILIHGLPQMGKSNEIALWAWLANFVHDASGLRDKTQTDAPHDQPMTKVLPEATVSSPQLLQSHHHNAFSICLVTPLIPLVSLGGSAHPAQEHHVHTFARQPALLAVRVLPRRIWDVHEVSLGKVESRERYDG